MTRTLRTRRHGNGMVVMAVTAAAISSAVALGVAKTQNAQFKAMDKAKDERLASQYAQDRADIIRSTKWSSVDKLDRQQIGTSGYYEEVTVDPAGAGDEKLVRVNIYKGATSTRAISTLAIKRRNPGSIQANLVQEPGLAIDAAMSQKAATDTFVMRDNVYNKTETEFFVRQEIATALFEALKTYLPRAEAEQVYRLCSESYTKGDTDSLLNALETVMGNKTDANKAKIDVLNTYFDTNGYAKRAVADQNGNNIVATYQTKSGMSSYRTVADSYSKTDSDARFLAASSKAVSAATADSATKATQDGNGRNIVNTYRTIADSYTKTEVDSKLNTKLNLSGGTMTGNITLNNNVTIVQNQQDTSNYTTSNKWLKGSKSQGKKYDPQIGQHNTGGDGTGSITLLPYATDSDPWSGNVGLFIYKNGVKIDGNVLLTETAGNSKYLGISAKAASAGSADSATKATQDGSGRNIVNTYRTIADSYSKTDADGRYLGISAKAVSAGSADSATKATKDGSGNVIVDTYQTKAGMSSYLTTSGKAASAATADSATKATQDGSGRNIVNTYRTIADSYTKTEVDSKLNTKLNLSGGTMTGDLTIKHSTLASNAFDAANPKITFSNSDGSQKAQLIYSDYDSLQAPDSLTLRGNQSGTVFIAPVIKAEGAIYEGGTALSSKYLGISAKAASAGSADSATKATQDGSGRNIVNTYRTIADSYSKTDADGRYLGISAKAVSAGSADSATKATKDGSGNVIVDTYQTKAGMSSYLTTSGKAASAATADSATKATQDGSGRNIVNTYRTIADSYSKTDSDARYLGISAKASTAGTADKANFLNQNNQLTYGINGLNYFNQTTSTTSGPKSNANPTSDWYHIIRENHANSAGYFVDIANAFHQNAMYYRRIVNGADQGWVKLANQSDVYTKTDADGRYLGKSAKAVSAGSADTATKATQDGSGNVITSTYQTKAGMSSYLTTTGKAASATTADSATKATQDASGNTITSTYLKINDAVNTYLTKSTFTSTGVTHGANTQVGSATNPVYIASNGVATAGTYSFNKAEVTSVSDSSQIAIWDGNTLKYVKKSTIGGGDQGIPLASCSTATLTGEKVATVTAGSFSLFPGTAVLVTFTQPPSHLYCDQGPNNFQVWSGWTVLTWDFRIQETLNVNNSGAKVIKWNGVSTASSWGIAVSGTFMFVYDGTYWVHVGTEASDFHQYDNCNCSCSST